MMDISAAYNRNDFLWFLSNAFLPDDFQIDSKRVAAGKTHITRAEKLGYCPSLDLSVYEFKHKSNTDPRVMLSRESFKIIETHDIAANALGVFYNEDTENWRFSLITSEYSIGKNDKQVKRTFSNPRRFSWLLGKDCKRHTPESMLFTKGKIASLEDLSARFAIDVVTKKFYQELFNWYDTWAVHTVKFPAGEGAKAGLPKIPDSEANRQHLIRLITRLIFVWFIKQKRLVPDWIFDAENIKNVLADFDPNSGSSGNYYNGIIQNLFFATLNKAIEERCFAKKDEKERKEDYGIKTKYRDFNDKTLFAKDADLVKLFETVPFLNGGLFECLDRRDGGEKQRYVDGFSREKSRAAFVPNCLFFGDGAREGIIGVFNRYNFTVEENTPQDIDIALDPELLGKVFENLLGTYNEETKSTARNESGSFYTPREIVDYMVDTSLKEYFKGKCPQITQINADDYDIDKKLDALFSYTGEGHDFYGEETKTLIEAIQQCRILDPACGSGAFPMGVLNKLVLALSKLDPKNDYWRALQKRKALAEMDSALGITDKAEREKRLKEIDDVFEQNQSDYGRKLYLIENCIYGVDIQPIAIQISKLRFFISLIVDQKTDDKKENNYDVLPLPNLETKFVAANTLIGAKREEDSDLPDTRIDAIQKELLNIRHKHFSARKADEKIKLRKEDEEKCNELLPLLVEDGFYNPKDAQLMAKWNPYDQTKPADFFDAYWMFGIRDGFDVVIGNPPYKVIRNDDENKKTYETNYGYIKSGRVNIYQLFFGCAESLLCGTGCVTFIHPKTLLADAYLSATRKFIADKFSSFTIVNILSRTDTFGAVLQSVVVSLWNKNQSNTVCHVSEVIKKSDITNMKYLYLSKNDIVSPHKTLLISGNSFVYQIEKKLRNIETLPLNFVTGSIEWNKYTSHLSGIKKPNSKRLIYGENIQRFYFAESRKRAVTTFLGNKASVPILTETAIFTQRTTAVEQPYRIIASIIDPKKFDIPVVSENGTNVFICKDVQTAYYILGILNSKLIDFYFRLFNSNTHVSSTELNRLPIIKPEKATLDSIAKQVQAICAAKAAGPQADTSALEREIDALVYSLYGLTADEITVLDKK